MKKLFNAIILVAVALLLFSCAPTENSPDDQPAEYKLRGVVENLANKYVDIRITEAQYATGTYRILLDDTTKIYDKSGKSVSASAIQKGDSLEVTYNGQVMRSIPPQVVALKITIS